MSAPDWGDTGPPAAEPGPALPPEQPDLWKMAGARRARWERLGGWWPALDPRKPEPDRARKKRAKLARKKNRKR